MTRLSSFCGYNPTQEGDSINSKRNAVTGFLFILPSLIGTLALVIIPFFASLYYSFTAGITRIKFVWLQNFTDLFGNPTFSLAAKNTAIFIGIGVPILFIISLSISLILADSKAIFERWALLAPLIVPISTVIVGWRFLFADNGIVNQFLIKLGFDIINFFGEDYAMLLIIVLFIWKNVGYVTVIFTSAIVTLPKEYSESFSLDSKSGLKLARYITLPLIAPIAFFAVVISVMNSFKVFREIYVLFGDYPPKSIYMLQHFMNNNFLKLNYQRLSTAAFIFTAILFIFIWIFLKAQNKYIKSIY